MASQVTPNPNNNRPRRAVKLRSSRKSFFSKFLSSTVVVSAVGGLYTLMSSHVDKLRTDKLAAVNAQLEKLYGPVYSTAQASDVIWEKFRALHMLSRKGQPIWTYCDVEPQSLDTRDTQGPQSKPRKGNSQSAPSSAKTNCVAESPTLDEVTEWRTWVKAVFQPMNGAMEKAISDNSNLVIGTTMPQVFLDLIAHSEGYKAVIASWQSTDISSADYTARLRNLSLLNYPTVLLSCARDGFELLKARQDALSASPIATFAKELPPPCSCISQPYGADWDAVSKVTLRRVATEQYHAFASWLGWGPQDVPIQCVLPKPLLIVEHDPPPDERK